MSIANHERRSNTKSCVSTIPAVHRLSPSAQRVREFISAHVETHGTIPMQKAICAALGWQSRGPLVRAINELVAKGVYSRDSQSVGGLSVKNDIVCPHCGQSRFTQESGA